MSVTKSASWRRPPFGQTVTGSRARDEYSLADYINEKKKPMSPIASSPLPAAVLTSSLLPAALSRPESSNRPSPTIVAKAQTGAQYQGFVPKGYAHFAARLASKALPVRETGGRPSTSEMNAAASINFSRSTPVAMPRPSSMKSTSSVPTLPVAPFA
jgi:hypothetical protein